VKRSSLARDPRCRRGATVRSRVLATGRTSGRRATSSGRYPCIVIRPRACRLPLDDRGVGRRLEPPAALSILRERHAAPTVCNDASSTFEVHAMCDRDLRPEALLLDRFDHAWTWQTSDSCDGSRRRPQAPARVAASAAPRNVRRGGPASGVAASGPARRPAHARPAREGEGPPAGRLSPCPWPRHAHARGRSGAGRAARMPLWLGPAPRRPMRRPETAPDGGQAGHGACTARRA